MKFMKLGSKPDAFHTDGDNIRYVATELSSDLIVNVVDVKFYLHKFPLLSKSARLQKLVDIANEERKDEIYIQDIPGGPAAFEICAKYCYGMTVTLNAYNIVSARCAAEYLEMQDTVEKGNLVYKLDVFLNSSLFRGWKDSIIVLQSTKSLLQWSKELKPIISHCVDALASMASMDTSRVEWSYTYNKKKLISQDGMKNEHPHSVPKDWWVEDLCDLEVGLYNQVISCIKTKDRVSGDVIGEALKVYLVRRLPGFSKGMVQGGDSMKNRLLVETVVCLLPGVKGSVSCSFLLRLMRVALVLECKETVIKELTGRIAWQLDDASVADLLIRASPGGDTVYNVGLVIELVKEFIVHEENELDSVLAENDFQEFEMSKGMVAKLVDCYLAEVSRDPNLPVLSFMSLAELVSGFPRPSHDGLYRAIDMFLKEHPGISKSERKRICRLMDCRKLSVEASAHAVQNERLPLRVVVQILFFEQARGGLASGGSRSSSRSATTNTEEDLDGVPTTEELKALKGELASLRLGSGEATSSSRTGPTYEAQKAASDKVKGLLMSKRLVSKMVSSKDRDGENSSSE